MDLRKITVILFTLAGILFLVAAAMGLGEGSSLRYLGCGVFFLCFAVLNGRRSSGASARKP
jgi:hypothetical protein